ncbi:hypothetical protein GJ744_001534 [Endocarpon pusillum]|uniref:Uncharacterized protein n=1 Tax=Endocarpon pusillum TaxID=364733 RepID=A0A8H7AA18_9EURO|nr:hypothetical protein GJ744_001534 [Endocarpon pusillum]
MSTITTYFEEQRYKTTSRYLSLNTTSNDISSAEGAQGDNAGGTELVYASCNGHGTFEMLDIVQALEKAIIDCCMVGVSALKFYGARGMGHEWELCVPTEKFEETISLLKSETVSDTCQEDPSPIDKMLRLYDTFPRFRRLKV